MKNILLICNTHYQLIVAMQMRLTSFENENVYALITNRSRRAEQVAQRLKETGLFSDVFYQAVKEPKGKRANICERIAYIKGAVWGSKRYRIPAEIVFDEIIGFNLDLHSHMVFANECKKNPQLKCEKMEEGLLSYKTKDSTSGVLSTVYRLRRLRGLPNMKTGLSKFYCFEPAAYDGPLHPVSIPKLSVGSEKLKAVLSDVFSMEDVREDDYAAKYIYLPCVYDFEGGEPIGELALALRIAEVVGRENLLVKVHPRDDAEKYKQYGLKVDARSGIPWEAIQIKHDFSDKVLISTLSTSLLTSASLFDNPPKSYYAFRQCDLSGNRLAQHYRSVIEGYLQGEHSARFTGIKVCDSIEQIVESE